MGRRRRTTCITLLPVIKTGLSYVNWPTREITKMTRSITFQYHFYVCLFSIRGFRINVVDVLFSNNMAVQREIPILCKKIAYKAKVPYLMMKFDTNKRNN